MMRQILAIALLLLFPALTWSQTGSITGTLIDKSNGESVPFGSVILEETKDVKTTDENGNFVFSQLKPGTYTVTALATGLQKVSEKVTVPRDGVARVKLYAEPEGGSGDVKELGQVDIEATSIGSKTQVRTSVITATKKSIDAVPTVGGQSDIATYFQTVPGVVTTGDQGGQMYVRGGAPIQNKVMLDGMVIYNPFHSIGFFSVFDTDIIKTADIYTGGYNAEHGGRISSVMDITTRDGNKQETDGKISVSPFGAKVLLEGPIGSKKKRSKEGAQLSYLLSGKTSYLAQSSKIFYQYANKDGLPFNYTDLYGKFSANTGNGSKFNLFGFNFTDSVTYQSISKLKWNTFGGGTNFVLLLPGSPVITEGHFAYSQYDITLDDKTNQPRSSSISSFNGGFDFKYYLKKNEVKYGIEVLGYNTNFLFYNAAGLRIEQDENTSEIAGYVTYKITAGRLLIEPGFRAHYYASLRNFSPEPRIGLKFNFTDVFRMKASGGLYSQNLIAANSDRDVVNLFYGFLSGSQDLPSTYTTGPAPDGKEIDRKHALQKSTHAILGFEYDLNTRLTFNIEGYYKRFNQLTNINRNKIYDADDASKPDISKLDYIIETGNAYGVDFLAKYSTQKTYIWFVYSLGKVDRWDGIQEYAPVWDRRHNINVVATQKFGKKNAWEVSARWNFGSGLPFTPTKGVYAKPVQGTIASDYITANPNDITYVYGDLNSRRLPTYHRFDLTVKRTFEFFRKIRDESGIEKNRLNSRLEINAGATNIYNRDNIFYVERSNNQVVNQLPIIPSVGVSYEF